MQTIKRFLKDEQGLETVEYAILLGLIVAGTIAAVVGIGAWVSGRFEATESQLTTDSPADPGAGG